MKKFLTILPLVLFCFVALATNRAAAQDWVHAGTNMGNQRIRLAAADFKPVGTDPATPALKAIFDATLANGESLSVDGFMTVDEEAIGKLPDAQIAQMHRNGLLGLLQVHTISLNNMRRLLDRRLMQSKAAAV